MSANESFVNLRTVLPQAVFAVHPTENDVDETRQSAGSWSVDAGPTDLHADGVFADNTTWTARREDDPHESAQKATDLGPAVEPQKRYSDTS